MYKFFTRASKDANKQKPYSSLHFKVSIQGKPTSLCTNIQVNVKEFEEKCNAKKASTLDNYLKSIIFDESTNTTLYDKLNEISVAVSAMVKDKASKEEIKERIRSIVTAESVARENLYHEEKEKAIKAAEERKKQNVLNYVDEFLKDIKEGRQTSRGGQYNKNTIRIWKQFHRIFTMFYKKHPFTWNDINKTQIGKFEIFMLNDGQAKTTTAKYMGCLRTIIRFAYDEGINDNPKSLRTIVIKNAKEHEKAKEVYLSDEELRALYSMELSGMREKVRDVFLIGCFTAQRFSDYSKICKDDFIISPKGNKVIRIYQQKTRKKVVVPILNDMLTAIAEKYDYTMPNVVEQVLNRYIKEILHELSEQVPSLAKKETTILMKAEREAEKNNKGFNYERNNKGEVLKQKWEMVTSHTARRTGATLMYLSGNYTIQQMMKITGHSTFSIFESYIKLSGEEFADDIKKRKENEEAIF